MAIYNAIAPTAGWPKAEVVTPQRRNLLPARLRDCGGLDGWRQAMERAARSAFLRGDNDRGWRASIDFFLQAKSFTKLMEGAYDDRSKAPEAARTMGSAVTTEQWDRLVGRHRDDPSLWPFGTLGPPPDEPGCRAPTDVLARHGYARRENAA
ncbi:hypothetical protein J2X65_004293 [Ancylobacter sp. 3268]|uniref:hypothetical protein n=1 Tax=Ancylobacter sp. 3268 TaxID=2817752 RepID=UPI002859F1CD|nr:hypothetical protein [Ancylobacter sp. 3268]MDR6954917.1 hypothetical protein [Ancylobacter sp. 3268]